MAESSAPRPVDDAALSRVRRRWAQADEAPWLHGEVARRMAERLVIFKRAPEVVIDWWSHSGASREPLAAAYPRARIVRVEQAPSRRAAPPSSGWLARLRRAPAAVDASALQPDAAQLLWANMALHALDDPQQALAQWQRALTTDGFVMFSTLGPDTLKTLREIYRDAGWGPPHAPFVDMHDLGDMLVHAGFADPVMDQELLRLTWATPAALLAELHALGSNADPARHAGLRTPRWRARLEAALAARAASDGRIALEFEIVYGHAFKPPPRVRAAGETRVEVGELQRMARAGRSDGSLR
jgi:malonyl-CoA O-methyltransferase